MPRLFALLLTLLAAATGFAQPDPEPKDGKVTIPMELSPVAPTRPAAKLYLFPEYMDQRPGNRVFGLIKTFMEQDAFYRSEPEQQRAKWLEMPLADLPADVRKQAAIHDGIMYNPKYASMMVRVDQAARYTHVDWDEWFDIRKDGAYYLLPELQKLRSLANVVRLRMRGEVKNGEFDKAIESAKTLFGMAKALEQHPTLIGFLVGVAIAAGAQSVLEEMVQQPGCPNLYWSFSDLPRPPLSIRTGAAGERVFLLAQFGDFMKASRALSDTELNESLLIINELVGMGSWNASQSTGDKILDFLRKPALRYQFFAADPKRVAEGRKKIIARGASPDLVATFTPLQVVITDDLYRFEEVRDELFKWINLPYPEAVAGMNKAEEELKKELRLGDSILGPMLLPSVHKVKQTEVRCEQRFAILRTIEAIRLHAHENGGKLPEKLADIKVPVPSDPVSGQPFEYAVKDGVATLHGANHLKDAPRTNRYYELRIRK